MAQIVSEQEVLSPPRTHVSYAATVPFVRAFPKEAVEQERQFREPTWSVRISEAPAPETPPPTPPSMVRTTTPNVVDPPAEKACSPPARDHTKMIMIGVIFCLAGYIILSKWMALE